MTGQQEAQEFCQKFSFHHRLIKATLPLGDTRLSKILMLNDHRYPWVLLVPRREGVEEIFQLNSEDRVTLIDEISEISKGMVAFFKPFRINVADIGNQVAQIHIHIVARKKDDPAWPEVVWSKERFPYENIEKANEMRAKLMNVCSELDHFLPEKILKSKKQ